MKLTRDEEDRIEARPTNAYVAVRIDSEGYWQWRIECVEGYYPWEGHYATEAAAKAAGNAELERIIANGNL